MNPTDSTATTHQEGNSAPTLEEHFLTVAQSFGPEKIFVPADVAQAFRPAQPGEAPGKEQWRSYLRQVRATAVGLARAGTVEILRKGKPIDPKKPFRGVYKLRLVDREE